MRYVDTSVLLTLFLNEAKTADAWAWLKTNQGKPLFASHWTLTELSSALGVKARMKAIDEPERQRVMTAFQRFTASRLTLVASNPDDFSRAAAWCDRWALGLRAGDALHLAIAERCGLTVCTLDRGMWTAAQALGVDFETF